MIDLFRPSLPQLRYADLFITNNRKPEALFLTERATIAAELTIDDQIVIHIGNGILFTFDKKRNNISSQMSTS